jgi:hypothetical protein
MSGHVMIDANALANWLAKSAGSVLWTVDGEDTLEAQLDLPCTGSDLAVAVRRRGGELLVLTSAAGSAGDPGSLAVRDDRGGRVFELAWKSDPDRSWFVAEDVEEAPSVAASR